MIINSLGSIANGDTLVKRTGGDSWLPVILPAVFRTVADATLYMVAEVDSVNGDWLHLNRPWTGPDQTDVAIEVVMDYTPNRELPIANIGDVNMADLFNRAMILLDQIKSPVPLHGPTHVGLGTDPVPLASSTDSGLCPQLSGMATDYLGGDGECHQSAGVPTGCIVPFGGTVVPLGWLLCDGSAVLRSSYGNLFATIGTLYGAGDGVTTFNLPDCRGRVLMGAGTGPGLSNRPLAEMLGEEAHVLTVNELAAHAHQYQDDGHEHGIPNPYGQQGLSAAGTTNAYWISYGVGYTAKAGVGITIQNTGANWGHNNIQPSLAVNAIIRS